MKISLIISALILGIASLFGVNQYQQLVQLRTDYKDIKEKTTEMGLKADDDPVALTKRAERIRENQSAKIQALADQLIDFMKVAKEAEENGQRQPMPEQRKKISAFMKEMANLAPRDMKALLEIMKSSDELDDKSRREMVGFMVMTMSQKQPESALEIMLLDDDYFKDNKQMKEMFVGQALQAWGMKDPEAALNWLRRNEKDHSDLAKSSAKMNLIASAAGGDIGRALKLAKEFDLQNTGRIFRQMARGATTPEARTKLLASLRQQQSSDDKAETKGLSSQVMSGLARNLADSGFEEGEKWLKTANLKTEEVDEFAKSLQYWNTKQDSGKWLDWMATQSMGDDAVKRSAGNIVRQWTEKDYKAAGNWLNETAEGPVKQASISEYAKAVAPYDKEAALQWADKLPAGEDKTQLLKRINNVKPKE